jgi:uncharacterized protein (DUF305 family)
VSRRYRTSLNHLVCLLVAVTAAGGLAACGSDDKETESGGAGNKVAAVEKAFLTGMVDHHRSAIEMAKIAEKRGEDPYIKRLAGDIMSTQDPEIVRMVEIYERLFGGKLKPDPGAHEELGLSAEEAGMTHSPETTKMLQSAEPFDRAFVDEMVPHHEGAVKMAKVALKSTKDADLRELAEGIIATQEREIAEMNDFRTKKFGAPVPEGAGHGKGSEGAMPKEKEEHGAGHSE